MLDIKALACYLKLCYIIINLIKKIKTRFHIYVNHWFERTKQYDKEFLKFKQLRCKSPNCLKVLKTR
jgi:hypothetical protein